MTSEMDEFLRLKRRWHDLHERWQYSEYPDEGTTAYLYSTTKVLSPHVDSNYFEIEAEMSARKLIELGRSTLLLAGMTEENVRSVLTNRLVSDVVIIGNGNFSSLYLDEHTDEGNFKKLSWDKAAMIADHLKRGKITKRTCGHYSPLSLNVPFGSFVVDDHRNLYGPMNESFAPEDYRDADRRHDEEKKILQQCGRQALSLDYILNNYDVTK